MQGRGMHAIREDARLIYGFLAGHEEPDAHADILLIPGSHDLRVADHAARLFLQGAADWLVCSGGYGKVTEERFQKPEAQLFAERCATLGVDPARIILEPEATNTGENFTLSRLALEKRGIKPRVGLIVCKPYMARRAWATARQQWPEPRWMVSPLPLAFEEYASPDTPYQELIELMVGDLQRMDAYAQRSFQVPVDVPEEVQNAWQRLVEDGYSRYVIQDQG